MSISSLTLILWVAKCIIEIRFLYYCIVRDIRFIWILAAYSFPTTLMLMLISQYASYHTYYWFDSLVSILGTMVFAVTMGGIVILAIEKHGEYYAILATFTGILISQFTIELLYKQFGGSRWLSRVAILSWAFGIHLLTQYVKRFQPRWRKKKVISVSVSATPWIKPSGPVAR